MRIEDYGVSHYRSATSLASSSHYQSIRFWEEEAQIQACTDQDGYCLSTEMNYLSWSSLAGRTPTNLIELVLIEMLCNARNVHVNVQEESLHGGQGHREPHHDRLGGHHNAN